jgi:ribonucleoside-diphosphate reductase beta chain
MIKSKLFNITGDDSLQSQSIFGGNPTGILNLNNVKYKWVNSFYKVMTGNFWIPERVSLVNDSNTIKNLTNQEYIAVKETLSFLIFLDSMQVNNLPNIADYVTNSGVKNLLGIQAFQEIIHSQSYQYLLESLFSNEDREEIYENWRKNPLLLKRIKFIADTFQEFVDDPSEEVVKRVLVANLALEGIYFYCGFNLFDQLSSRKKLPQAQKIIDYIRTDENSHCALFSKIINETMDTEKEKDWIYKFIGSVVEQEIEWSCSIYGEDILGINNKSTAQFVKWLANKRLRAIGLAPLYEATTNPYQHLEKGSDTPERENFFETGANTSYSRSEAVSGWDEF